MANDLKLQEGHPVDENLRPLKVGGESTAIETAKHGNGVRLNGDVEITGSIKKGATIDGDLIISGSDVKIDAEKKLYFDGRAGDSETYISEVTDDNLAFTVGGDSILYIRENGDDGNTVNVKVGCLGFTRLEASYGVSGVIGDGGTNTDIDFRFTNKYRLEMTGDISTMNLIFPPVSGNFLLVCTTDGDHDVSNWKVFESDESAATTTDVMWAGGSVPAFTSSGIDIVSFYWDGGEQQAYGVASLAFATP